MTIEVPAVDLSVGVLRDGPLRCRVSLRNGNIVMQFANGPRAIELTFSPRAAKQLCELTEEAARLAEGR